MSLEDLATTHVTVLVYAVEVEYEDPTTSAVETETRMVYGGFANGGSTDNWNWVWDQHTSADPGLAAAQVLVDQIKAAEWFHLGDTTERFIPRSLIRSVKITSASVTYNKA